MKTRLLGQPFVFDATIRNLGLVTRYNFSFCPKQAGVAFFGRTQNGTKAARGGQIFCRNGLALLGLQSNVPPLGPPSKIEERQLYRISGK